MPELPEVEYTRRQLHRAMHGARIERVLVRRPDLRYPFQRDFVARLQGQTVRAVTRRAKYLLITIVSGDVLIVHLGMSGSFRILRGKGEQQAPGAYYYGRSPLAAHDHVVFEMSTGAAVVFNDPRRFGFMKIAGEDAAAAETALSRLGPEPLGRAFTAAVLTKALARRKTSLKAALLDQRVVAGLGNIYVVEALHRARLSPTRRASTLATVSGAPQPEAVALVAAIKAVLADAVANRHRMSGEDRFRVYDREGKGCPRRGCAGVLRRITQAGRSTFYCPVCQH